jgi:outer membrane usher protein
MCGVIGWGEGLLDQSVAQVASPNWRLNQRFPRQYFAVPLLWVASLVTGGDRILAEEKEAGEAYRSELLLRVKVNGEDKRETALFLKKDQSILAPADELKRWHIRLPEAKCFQHDGRAYCDLASVKGVSHHLDAATQTISIEADSKALEPTTQELLHFDRASPVPPSLGGFVNYNVFGQGTTSRGQLDAVTEIGVFNRWGVGTTRFLGRDLGGDSSFERLESTWNLDRPDHLSSFRFGDAITRAGAWGRPVRFGGVQWATNFATQPGFVTFPLPTLRGEAALPSTADLFLNDVLVRRGQVAPGPFSITNVPVLSGQGELQLVTRDIFGREQVITQPYYAGTELLRSGLHDYSYEVGVIRRNYAIESNDYGRALAIGTHRYGFTDRFTGEAHGELFKDQQTLGTGGAWLWDRMGVFSFGAAGSHRDGEIGTLAYFGFQRQTRGLSFGGRVQLTSRDFVQAGLAVGEPAPALLGEAHLGLPLNSWGFVNLGYIRQDRRDRQDLSALTASYSVTVGNLGFLNLAAFLPLDGAGSATFMLGFTRAFGERTSGSVSHLASSDSDQTEFRLQRNLPVGTGLGYRLAASVGTSERFEGGISLQNQVGSYALDVAHNQNETFFRGQATGGVVFMRNKAFLSREITDSFGIVQVGHFPNVRLYAFNQPVAETDEDGVALIPRLLAYQKNPIRVEQADLPLDAEVGALQLDAVPYFRNGVWLEFPVKRADGAVFEIRLENGESMPAGAIVRVLGTDREFPVGLRGQVYVTGLARKNRLQAAWGEQNCEMDVEFPDTREPLPDLGVVTCREVAP